MSLFAPFAPLTPPDPTHILIEILDFENDLST